MSNDKCPICKSNCEKGRSIYGNDAHSIDCPRCGNFYISRTACVSFSNADFTDRQRAVASSVFVTKGPWEMISTNDKERLFKAKDIPVTEKANKLLLELEKRCSHIGKKLSIDWHNDHALWAKCWLLDAEELYGLLEHLYECKLIKETINKHNEFQNISITSGGWEKIEQLKNNIPESNQGFVAMWFDKSMDNIYKDCIAPAIEKAGYVLLRIDKKEHSNKIEDEIIAEIRKSKFLVADMTGHRGGVYYEAGFAHGLRLKVILTCRTDAFKDLHFDLSHYKCIEWFPDKLEEFKTALIKRIEADFGHGPVGGT